MYKHIKFDILIGNLFVLTDYSWKNWQTEFPMCRCEETAEPFFLACSQNGDIRPKNTEPLDLLDPEDCNTLVNYISQSKKSKGNEKNSYP